MESFWTAETLKYYYLIFAEPDLVSLDEYVLYVILKNTCCLLKKYSHDFIGTRKHTLSSDLDNEDLHRWR